jgi:glycosyltransferase involved in cell wall biosynthesis
VKIVINAFSAKVGGGQTYLSNLLSRLPTDDDLEIHLFVQPDLAFREDPRIRRVDTHWPVSNPLTRTVWERLLLPRYLRSIRADLLFCPGGVVATRSPRGCRTATMFRNMLPFDAAAVSKLGNGLQAWRNRILKPVMLRSMREADLTIFVSDYARRTIEAIIPVPHAVTIPHGIAPAFRTADSACPPRPAGITGDYILYVSRLDVYKHHREVVEAFAAVPQGLRFGIKLLFAGERDGDEAERVASLIEAKGLSDQILFLGPVPYHDLPALYANARATVFASSCENCPNILLEALGAGRPVLSSNIMPMPEFGGSDIAYFSPYEPASLAKELARILEDPDYATNLAAASRARSRAYDWASTAERTWQALRAAAAGRR